jgi:hypothetical protein
MRENTLTELRGNSRLALGFFNSLIRRIECTKPIAGDGIAIQPIDNGFLVSVSLGINGGGGGGGGFLRTIDLNVCSNGTPDVIQVYGPAF